MLSFKSFLESVENLRESPQLAPSHRYGDIQDRLAFGHSREDFAIAVLERMIGPVQRTNSGADMGRGRIGNVSGNFLDGVITNKFTGQSASFQFKSRESGTDILVEVYKNLNVNPPHIGRDVRTTAELYVVLSPDRTVLNVFNASKVKAAAQQLEEGWRAAGSPGKFENVQGVIRMQTGDSPGSTKLVAYINPNSVRSGMNPAGVPGKIMIPKDMIMPQVQNKLAS